MPENLEMNNEVKEVHILKACPECRNNIPIEEINCPHCMRDFDVFEVGFCAPCGETIKLGMQNLCPHCGNTLTNIRLSSEPMVTDLYGRSQQANTSHYPIGRYEPYSLIQQRTTLVQTPSYRPRHYPRAATGTSMVSIESLVLGVLGIAMIPAGALLMKVSYSAGALAYASVIIISILAIIFSNRARREIKISRGLLGGIMNANAGFVLGIIGPVIAVSVFTLITVLVYY